MSAFPKIEFVEDVRNTRGLVAGRLCVEFDGWNNPDPDGRFLAAVSDAHPDFVAAIVTTFNKTQS